MYRTDKAGCFVNVYDHHKKLLLGGYKTLPSLVVVVHSDFCYSPCWLVNNFYLLTDDLWTGISCAIVMTTTRSGVMSRRGGGKRFAKVERRLRSPG